MIRIQVYCTDGTGKNYDEASRSFVAALMQYGCVDAASVLVYCPAVESFADSATKFDLCCAPGQQKDIQWHYERWLSATSAPYGILTIDGEESYWLPRVGAPGAWHRRGGGNEH